MCQSPHRVLAVLLVACVSLPGQAAPEPDPQQPEALGRALRAWAAAFDAGDITPTSSVRLGAGHGVYGEVCGAGGVLTGQLTSDRYNHTDLLQKMLLAAEERGTVAMARALLPLASAGFEKPVYDPASALVRDQAHWSLMRMLDPPVWLFLLRVAAGDAVPWVGLREEPEAGSPALQVAAIRLLGSRNHSVFRPTIESRLYAGDARIRLGAAEAIERMRRPQSLAVLGRALGAERHPVVSQALVGAVAAILRIHREQLPPAKVDRAIRMTLRLLGRTGWRTDMAVVELAEKYPSHSVITALIEILYRTNSPPDALVAAVNRRASPMLRRRAWEALQSLLGVLLPIDQPEQWEEFWEREKHRIVLVSPAKRRRSATSASFYGITVAGQEIAFLIDTSGSMQEAAGQDNEPAPKQWRRKRAERRPKSRLDAAREQLLKAVQSMDSSSRYHLLTFANEVLAWNSKPVPPIKRATTALTETLERLQPKGGTNVFDALIEALRADQLYFGQQSKLEIDELFLLSDGEPTKGRIQDPTEILRTIRQVNRYQRVRINTVFTGQGDGADFLRQLAAQNDGVFVHR